MKFLIAVFKTAKQFFSTFGREVKFVFRFLPFLASIFVCTQLLIGILPAAVLFFGARIVDSLVAVVSGTAAAAQLWHYVIIELVLLFFQRLIFATDTFVSTILREQLVPLVNDLIHRRIVALDTPTLEQSEIQTLITYLKDNAWRPYQMIWAGFATLSNFVASLSFISLAFLFSPKFTLLFVVAIIPALIVSAYTQRRSNELWHGRASIMRRVWYIETLFRQRTSLIEMLVHNVGKYFTNLYHTNIQGVVKTELAIQRQRLIGTLAANLFAFGVYVFVYLKIILAAAARTISLGQFTLYAGAYVNLERFVVSQAGQLALVMEHTHYLNYFDKLNSLQPMIVEPVDARPLGDKLEIEFKNVSFRYAGAARWSIRHASFVLRPGERLALVGENGAGKSTLVKLMLRLYEPTEGEIFINGRNYREYKIDSLRQRIGVIFQDFAQFSFSARENIGLGQMEKMTNVAAIINSATQAGAHGYLSELPAQYETALGHDFDVNGVELSGGEWQKVALARTLIKDASLLILDEPTAALDARSEVAFFKKLFARNRTQSFLIISHRFSSVRVADRILVLQKGKIIEEGTHAALLKRGGLYSELYTLQTQKKI